jgi:signal peptidase I
MREAEHVELAPPPALAWRSTSLVTACLRWVLAALWFAIIPAVYSGLALRYLLPYSASASGIEGALSSFGRAHTLLCALLFFLCSTGFIRYWRALLPGGRYLSSLPEALVDRVPRRRVQVCEQACALLNWLDSSAGKRWLESAAAEQKAEVGLARAALSVRLMHGKWSRVAPAYEELRRLTRGADGDGLIKNISFFGLLAVAVVLALTMRNTLFQSYEVIGNSMLPGLTPGDLLAASVLTPSRAASTLKRGDVVVLRVAVDGAEQEIVKRVVGLPGDRIGMQGVHPVINGWAVPFCDAGAYYSPDDETAMMRGDPGGRVAVEFLDGQSYLTFQAAPQLPLAEYLVKPGEVFVLGDNRNNSRDSRSFDQGLPCGFPLTDVKAKVTRVLLSRVKRGEVDPASVWQPLGLALHLDALDLSEERDGIRRCLAARPAETSPPSATANPDLATRAQ